MPYPTRSQNLAVVNALYCHAYLAYQIIKVVLYYDVSSFTDHTQCERRLTDQAMADCHLQLIQ